MKRVNNAIEKGRCVVAVGGSLLRDADIMLALKEREALPSIALSGPAVAPVQEPSFDAMARAVATPGGVIVLVDPQLADLNGVKALAQIAQKGPNKPEIIVVAKAYNPFLFGNAFSGMKVSHEKGRGQSFLKDLPLPPAPAEVPVPEVAKAKAKKKGGDAPRFVFVGREEEVPALAGMLGQGGPIVVSGPSGVGRNLLIEHAAAEAGLTRLPDLTLGFSSGADTLAARIAVVAKEGGDDTLYKLLLTKGHKPGEVAKAAVASLAAASGTEGQLMVVRNLDHTLGRSGDFFRKSRLELLIEALLTAQYPLRLVFVARRQPLFYRDTHNQALRRVEVRGIKGRFLHEIFSAFHAPEFERDKFGPISERIHGHPLAARTFAIETRERQDGLEKVEDSKFMAAQALDDDKNLKKVLGKRVEKVTGRLREAMVLVAHLWEPVPGDFLADLGLSRKDRIELLALGLIDVIGTQEDKRYRVHPMVRRQLSLREITDFDILAKVNGLYAERARKSTGVAQLAWTQLANQAAELGRNGKARVRHDLPDDDAFLDSVRSILGRKEPRYDILDEQVEHMLARDPGNADAHLLRLRAMQQANAKQEVVAEALDRAIAEAPVPEVFHEAANFWMHRRARAKAITVMEAAVAQLPDHSRLHTRLAALLMHQGRRPEAISHLERAMELDPTLPDAYGILGLARRDEGALDRAEELYREAVRLAPTDAVQVSRLVDLLLDKARVSELDAAARLREEASALIDAVMREDKGAPEINLQLATLIRQQGGDLERSEWLLKQARKKTDRANERRARIRLEANLIKLAKGELDSAEKDIREMAERDPSNHGVFGALAQLLLARNLLIPAHAEFMRARERTAPNSLARLEYETEITRLQALIEAQAAGLVPQGPAPEAGPTEPELHSASAFRTIRRKGSEGEAPAEAPAPEAPAPEAAVEAAADESEDAPATEEAPVEEPEQPHP